MSRKIYRYRFLTESGNELANSFLGHCGVGCCGCKLSIAKLLRIVWIMTTSAPWKADYACLVATCATFFPSKKFKEYIYILYIHAFRDQKALMPCFDIFLSKKRWLIYLFFSSNTTKTIRPTLLMQLSLFAMCDVSAFQSWSHVISCHDLSLKLYVYIIDIVIPWYRCSFCSPQTPSQQAPIARLVASLPFVQLRDLQGAK